MNLNMNVHPLFPITVCEFNYPKANEFKQNLSKSIFKHLDQNGFSNEKTGHVNLHHEEEFNDLYCFLHACVEQYLKVLSVNVDNFDINFIKSWFNILKNRTTPDHHHGDAHISISYYVNVPKNCTQALRFNNLQNRVEPFPGCFRFNSNNWDMLNAYSWQFVPKEGDVFVFPAKLSHDTVGNPVEIPIDSGIKNSEDFEQHRICLAADVLLTYNEKKALPLGIQPVKNWRTFK